MQKIRSMLCYTVMSNYESNQLDRTYVSVSSNELKRTQNLSTPRINKQSSKQSSKNKWLKYNDIHVTAQGVKNALFKYNNSHTRYTKKSKF